MLPTSTRPTDKTMVRVVSCSLPPPAASTHSTQTLAHTKAVSGLQDAWLATAPAFLQAPLAVRVLVTTSGPINTLELVNVRVEGVDAASATSSLTAGAGGSTDDSNPFLAPHSLPLQRNTSAPAYLPSQASPLARQFSVPVAKLNSLNEDEVFDAFSEGSSTAPAPVRWQCSAPITLRKESKNCYVADIVLPLDGANADTWNKDGLWTCTASSSQKTPSGSKHGPLILNGTLHFDLASSSGSSVPDASQKKRGSSAPFNQPQEVRISALEASSRVILVHVDPASDKRKLFDPLPADRIYTGLMEALAEGKFGPSLDSTLYSAVWLHGALVGVFRQQKTLLPLTKLQALQIIQSSFGNVKEFSRDTFLLYWALVGQALALSGNEAYFTSAWGRPCNIETKERAKLQSWLASRGNHTWWKHGNEHIFRFVKEGLNALLNSDFLAPVPTFRYVRSLSLLADLGIIDVGSSGTAPPAAAFRGMGEIERIGQDIARLAPIGKYRYGGKFPMEVKDYKQKHPNYPAVVCITLAVLDLLDALAPRLRNMRGNLRDESADFYRGCKLAMKLDLLPGGFPQEMAVWSKASDGLSRMVDSVKDWYDKLRESLRKFNDMRAKMLTAPEANSLIYTYGFGLQDEEGEQIVSATLNLTLEEPSGFVLLGSSEKRDPREPTGVFIQEVLPETPAESAGVFRRGQQILSINGADALNMSRYEFELILSKQKRAVIEAIYDQQGYTKHFDFFTSEAYLKTQEETTAADGDDPAAESLQQQQQSSAAAAKAKAKAKAGDEDEHDEPLSRSYRVTTVAGDGQRGYVDTSDIEKLRDEDLRAQRDRERLARARHARAGAAAAADGALAAEEREKTKTRADRYNVRFGFPWGCLELPDGRILVTEQANHSVRVIEPSGRVESIVGRNGSGHRDGPARLAAMSQPKGMCLCRDGSVLVADYNDHRIRRINAALNEVTTIGGNGRPGFKDGVNDGAQFNFPSDVLELPSGEILVADQYNNAIRLIKPRKKDMKGPQGPYTVTEYVCTTLVGDPKAQVIRFENYDGLVKDAFTQGPVSFALTPKGEVYIAEAGGCCVRLLSADLKSIITVAGTPGRAGKRYGHPDHSLFRELSSICLLQDGSLILADLGNERILMLANNKVSVIAGERRGGDDYIDGDGFRCMVIAPRSLCRLKDGCVLLCEGLGNRVRKIATPEARDKAKLRFQKILANVRTEGEQLLVTTQGMHGNLSNVSQVMADVRQLSTLARFEILNKIFGVEAQQALQQENMNQLRALLVIAPSLTALANIVLALPSSKHASLHDVFLERIKNAKWPRHPKVVAAELAALTQLAERAPVLLDPSAATFIFSDRSFVGLGQPNAVDVPTLQLLVTLFQRHGREGMATLAPAVAAWVSRFQALSKSFAPNLETGDGKEFVHGTLWWLRYVNLASMGSGPERATMEWIIESHLTALCDNVHYEQALHGVRHLIELSLQPQDSSVPRPENLYALDQNPVMALIWSALKEAIKSHPIGVSYAALEDLRASSMPQKALNVSLFVRKAIYQLTAWIFERILGNRSEQLDLTQLLADPSQIATCCVFLIWYGREKRYRSRTTRAQTECGDLLDPRERLALLDGLWATVDAQAGAITASLLRTRHQLLVLDITNASLSELARLEKPLLSAWYAIEQHDVSDLIERTTIISRNARSRLQRLKAIALDFFPDSTIAADIVEQDSSWETIRLCEHLHFIRLTLPSPSGRAPEPEGSGKKADASTKVAPASISFSSAPVTGEQLPLRFVNAANWLHHLRNSALFRKIWESHDYGDDLERLMKASAQWQGVLRALHNDAIPISSLLEMQELCKIEEMKLLADTAPGFANVEHLGVEPSWAVSEGDMEWVDAKIALVRKWRHVQQLKDNLANVEASVALSGDFMSPAVAENLAAIRAALDELKTFLAGADWNGSPIKVVGDLTNITIKVDERWASIDPKVLEAMKASPNIMAWLRTFRDDRDFKASIEMAMGKSESECPFDLWADGRPNEKVLSSLGSLRSQCYSYLYRADETPARVQDFLDACADLPAASPALLEAFATLERLQTSLAELIDSQDNAGSSQLLQLQHPSRRAKWIICNAHSVAKPSGASASEGSEKKDAKALGLEHTLWMEFAVPGFDTIARRSMTELEDLHALMLLQNEDDRLPALATAVDKFVEQFAWARQLNKNLLELHESGHFDFRVYFCSFELALDAALLRAEAERTSKLLVEWREAIEEARRASYCLNFYTLKQLWRLADFLIISQRGSPSGGTEGHAGTGDMAITQELLLCWNPDLGFQEDCVTSFTHHLRGFWSSISAALRDQGGEVASSTVADPAEPTGENPEVTINGASASTLECTFTVTATKSSAAPVTRKVLSSAPAGQRLKCLGDTLENALADFPHRHRPVFLSQVGDQADMVVIRSGVHMISVSTFEAMADTILTAYAHFGYLPEPHELCLATPSTTTEEITTMVRRWEYAHVAQGSGSGSSRLFCLALFNAPFILQQEAAIAIRAAAPQAKCPLLLVTNADDGQHIAAQFAYCKTSLAVPPANVLQEIGQQLAQQHSLGIRLICSRVSGTGKSFLARTEASAKNLAYRYIPVTMNSALATQFARLLNETNLATRGGSHHGRSGQQGICIHLDVDVDVDTIGDELDVCLFSLAFLGYVGSSDRKAFWNTHQSSLILEMATGPLAAHMAVTRFLPVSIVRVKRDTFLADEELLRAGMGEDFAAWRYDGTVTEGARAGETSANAFQRLQYVCGVLINMEKGGFSSYPVDPETGTFAYRPPSEPIPATKCFDLLTSCISSGHKELSLWSIWNFVNVAYWLLREFFSPESVFAPAIQRRQSPTDGKFDVASMLAQLIQFLLETAQELGMRQDGTVSAQSSEVVSVQGFPSALNFNGAYSETHKVSMQRCFKHVTHNFYIFFRPHERRWTLCNAPNMNATVLACADVASPSEWMMVRSDAKVGSSVTRSYNHPKGHNNNAIIIKGMGSPIDGEYLGTPETWSDYTVFKKDSAEELYLYFSRTRGYWEVGDHPTKPRDGTVDAALAHGTIINDKGAGWVAHKQLSKVQGAVVGLSQRLIEQTMKFFGDESERSDASTGVVDTIASVSTKGENYAMALTEFTKNLLKWQESSHDCLVFSKLGEARAFALSLMPIHLLKDRLTLEAQRFMKSYGVYISESIPDVVNRAHEIISAITGVHRTKEDADQLLGGSYCLTSDNVMKMTALYVRIRCGIPVVLMGECGCGKTELLRYICAWLRVPLLTLDVHGGTTREDIIDIFERAERLLEENKTISHSVYVFLDEVNTCNHMGLLREVLCRRTLNGRRISDGITLLSALNPYREKKAPPGDSGDKSAGLVYKSQDTKADPMANLVYRVNPIPVSLLDFIFDFGQLQSFHEASYVQAMVARALPTSPPAVRELVSALIRHSLAYIREIDCDVSAASLRDVRRCLNLTNWFHQFVVPTKSKTRLSPLAVSVTLALAFTFWYRISSEEARKEYWAMLRKKAEFRSFVLMEEQFEFLRTKGIFEQVLSQVEKRFCDNASVESGIAMNDALMENLFVTIICILNRIPCMIVGKPGSSKTLALQVILSNLQGKQSEREFWRRFPAVHMFQFQCSPLSTASGILQQYEIAKRYQANAENAATVLVLDEIGLAEFSRDMPLKVLHGMLIDSPIAIVGVSNWVLDSAKMNRAVCLHRPAPNMDALYITGERILADSTEGDGTSTGGDRLTAWLRPLAEAYHEIYNAQTQGEMFFGMRDYYALLKLLKRKIGIVQGRDFGKYGLTSDILNMAVSRNFGGSAKMLIKANKVFHLKCLGYPPANPPPPVRVLIKDCLNDPLSRNLMIFTRNGAALYLLFGSGLLKHESTTVLVGSQFSEDCTELQLIQQINQVRLTMQAGRTLVLVNHFNIFESLYDLLNQRYVMKKGKNGETIRMLRLAIGSRSQLCRVSDGFKVIVIVEESVREQLDLPLLNRFERQLLRPTDMLSKRQLKVVEELFNWAVELSKSCNFASVLQLFGCFHGNTASSLILMTSDYAEDIDDKDAQDLILRSKQLLVRVATPAAMVHSTVLQELYGGLDAYFSAHADFEAALRHYVLGTASDQDTVERTGGVSSETRPLVGQPCLMLTLSPTSHLPLVSDLEGIDAHFEIIQLGQFASEKHLKDTVHNFYASSRPAHSVLVLQCDSLEARVTVILHAMWVIGQQYAVVSAQEGAVQARRDIVVVVHLPPGLRERQRYFSLNYQREWRYVFVDDLRKQTSITTFELLQNSAHDLFVGQRMSLSEVIRRQMQSAVAACLAPVSSVAESEEVAQIHSQYWRLRTLERLMQHAPFGALVERMVLAILRQNGERDAFGAFAHVSMAYSLNTSSLRDSLLACIDAMVRQSLAYTIRTLDVDFNLHLLDGFLKASNAEGTNLWFALAGHPSILDIDRIAAACPLGKKGTFDIPNSGQHGILYARFPFSARVVRALNATETRMMLEAKGKSTAEMLLGACNTIFSPEIIAAWTAFEGKAHFAYLHDFVSIAAPFFATISVETQCDLYATVFRADNPAALDSPATIHTGYWSSETRLFSYCSTLSSTFADGETKNVIFSELARQPEGNFPKHLADNAALRLVYLDSCVVGPIHDQLWGAIEMGVPESVGQWLDAFDQLSACVDPLLGLAGDVDAKAPLWREVSLASMCQKQQALRIASIYLEELALANYRPPEDDGGLFGAFLSKALACDAASSASLAELLPAVLASSMENSSVMSGFLVRYVAELVTKAIKDAEPREQGAGEAKTRLSATLADALLAIVRDSAHFSLGKFRYEAAPRRFLLGWLLEQGVNPFSKEYHAHFTSIHAHGIILLLQNIEDSGRNTEELTLDDVNLVARSPHQVTNLHQYTLALQRCQRELQNYARALLKHGYAPSSPEASPLLRRLLETSQGSLYAVQCMRYLGGLDGVGILADKSNKELSWVKLDRSHVGGAKGFSPSSMTDPFALLRNEKKYSQMCGAVYDLLYKGDVQPLNNLANVNDDNMDGFDAETVRVLLMAAICSQTFMTETIPSSENLSKMRNWIHYWTSDAKLIHLRDLYMWALDGFQLERRVFKEDNGFTSKATQAYVVQLLVHAVCVALDNPQGWLYTLLFNAEVLAPSYIPSMPENVMNSVFAASPYVGWYRCPSGHIYCVDACTMPMEARKCPDCKSVIGGHDHVPAAGNVKLSADDLRKVMTPIQGYSFDTAGVTFIARAPMISTLFLRFILNGLMLVVMSMPHSTSSAVQSVFRLLQVSNKRRPSESTYADFFQARMAESWKELISRTGLDNSSLTLGLHHVLRNLNGLGTPLAFFTFEEREKWENKFHATCVEKVFANQKFMDELRGQLSEASRNSALMRVWDVFSDRIKQASSVSGNTVLDVMLWRYRPAATFQTFARQFELNSENEKKYPLLATFLRVENRLPKVKALADILAWHALLFEAIPPNTITREEAGDITNEDVIEMLPEDKRAYAQDVLDSYCESFNEAFPLLSPNLFECIANPFLDDKNQVDLSGTKTGGVKMGPNVSIIYSLPSRTNGETDARGLCTLQLSLLLRLTHNELMATLAVSKGGAAAAAGLTNEEPEREIPLMSYLTPREVVRRRLLVYDRDEDLISLLNAHCGQELHPDTMSNSLKYDFLRIEQGIRHKLLDGKDFINIFVRQFPFAGELQNTGAISALRMRMHQEAIVPTTLDVILAEVDTQSRLGRLVPTLEDCITFLASVGGANVGGITGDVLLKDYVLGTLMIPEHVWNEMSTEAINRHVKLKHILSLFVALEQRMHGSALERVHAQYRVKLPSELKNQLMRSAHVADVNLLLTVLRDLLVNQLVDGNYSPDESLKEYLGYASEVALDDLPWFAEIPDALMLQHAFDAFETLSGGL